MRINGVDIVVTDVDSFGTDVQVYFNPSASYSINNVDDDGDDATVNYYGFENDSGGWYIMKEDKSANPAIYTYAKGGSDYATAWSGRGGQTYEIFGTTF